MDYEVIDRNWQPCYIDDCPNEGTEDYNHKGVGWVMYCPEHYARLIVAKGCYGGKPHKWSRTKQQYCTECGVVKPEER